MAKAIRGVVKSIKKPEGFGFVTAGGNDYFFHRSEVGEPGFEALTISQAVDFVPVERGKGLRAERVQVVKAKVTDTVKHLLHDRALWESAIHNAEQKIVDIDVRLKQLGA